MNIYQANPDKHKKFIHELFWEYLQWANERLNVEYDINFPIKEALETDMQTLAKFMPPNGRLLLAEIDDEMAGLACMKKNNETTCEIKRMYVRPNFRQKGVGRALVQKLIDDAKEMQFPIIRLDSSRFMTSAHFLYHSFGFQDIEPYQESEIPKEIQKHWVFMELKL